MRLNRTQNAMRNSFFGIVLKIYQIIVPFIMRTIFLYTLGVQYLGLNSLFSSILQVLNLAELGVGSAMVFSMYKPIADNDDKKVCALMNLYKKYYRIIGGVIACVGLIITPFVKYFISGDVPNDINIYLIYLLNLGATVLTYWLFAYKNSILLAFQRNDVIHKITIANDTVKYIFQIVALVFLENYYAYLIVILGAQIVNNIVTALVVDKMYPQYVVGGILPENNIKNIKQRIKDLFTAKIGGVLIAPADTLVISAFLGLTVLAIYQNYYYIVSSIIGVMTIIYQACTAGIGNSFVTETEEKNYRDFNKFTFIIMWIIGWCTCCLFCLYQPFMKVWMGEDLMMDNKMVVLFCLYFLVFEINQIFIAYKDAAGIWHDDRLRPLVVSVTNLILNIILIQFLDVEGIILATIISTFFIGMPWLLKNLFKSKFHRSSKQYVLTLIKYVLIIFAVIAITYCFGQLFNNLNDWMVLIARMLVCCVLPNLLFYLIYRKNDIFNEVLIMLMRFRDKPANKKSS